MAMLDGKIVLVTGAGRGLGRAYAEAAAKEGAQAVILADINEEWGESGSKALSAQGYDAPFVHVDLADPGSIEAMAGFVEQRYGRLDGLVNNGAIATNVGGKGFEEIEIATWDRVMQVNVRGTWLATRACAPLLRRSQAGKIVNVSSDVALWGTPLLLHYVSSKAAVIGMTRALARELGKDGIAVNAISPGFTKVEATAYVEPERYEFYVKGRAMKREQYPEDITGTVLFLLSDHASFVTGQLIPVNGGFIFN